MFKQNIDVKEFSEALVKKVMYDSEVSSEDNKVSITLEGKGTGTDEKN